MSIRMMISRWTKEKAKRERIYQENDIKKKRKKKRVSQLVFSSAPNNTVGPVKDSHVQCLKGFINWQKVNKRRKKKSQKYCWIRIVSLHVEKAMCSIELREEKKMNLLTHKFKVQNFFP